MRKLIVTPMQEELDFFLRSCTKVGCHAERVLRLAGFQLCGFPV